MNTFQIIVLVIATVLLILILTFFGVMLKYNKAGKSTAFPPNYGTCPDFWNLASDGSSCIIPGPTSLNTGDLYTPGTGSLTMSAQGTTGYIFDNSSNKAMINFNNSGWTGVCAWQTWANNNGVVWDGVSNYNSCQ